MLVRVNLTGWGLAVFYVISPVSVSMNLHKEITQEDKEIFDQFLWTCQYGSFAWLVFFLNS